MCSGGGTHNMTSRYWLQRNKCGRAQRFPSRLVRPPPNLSNLSCAEEGSGVVEGDISFVISQKQRASSGRFGHNGGGPEGERRATWKACETSTTSRCTHAASTSERPDRVSPPPPASFHTPHAHAHATGDKRGAASLHAQHTHSQFHTHRSVYHTRAPVFVPSRHACPPPQDAS